MNDKPTLRRRHICNQLSAVIAKLEELGCTPEQADRIVVAAAMAKVNAAYGLTAGAANPPVPEPEWGFRDGRWMKLEPEPDSTRKDT